MDDRTMLELAAKAAGIKIRFSAGGSCAFDDGEYWRAWNPLTSNNDALQLAITLSLVIDCSRLSCGEPFKPHTVWLDQSMGNAELTRRAITRCAAEIQLAKESGK